MAKLKLQTLTITLNTTLPQKVLKKVAAVCFKDGAKMVSINCGDDGGPNTLGKIESVQVTQPGNDR